MSSGENYLQIFVVQIGGQELCIKLCGEAVWRLKTNEWIANDKILVINVEQQALNDAESGKFRHQSPGITVNIMYYLHRVPDFPVAQYVAELLPTTFFRIE